MPRYKKVVEKPAISEPSCEDIVVEPIVESHVAKKKVIGKSNKESKKDLVLLEQQELRSSLHVSIYDHDVIVNNVGDDRIDVNDYVESKRDDSIPDPKVPVIKVKRTSKKKRIVEEPEEEEVEQGVVEEEADKIDEEPDEEGSSDLDEAIHIRSSFNKNYFSPTVCLRRNYITIS